jgi:hypothetical protein
VDSATASVLLELCGTCGWDGSALPDKSTLDGAEAEIARLEKRILELRYNAKPHRAKSCEDQIAFLRRKIDRLKSGLARPPKGTPSRPAGSAQDPARELMTSLPPSGRERVVTVAPAVSAAEIATTPVEPDATFTPLQRAARALAQRYRLRQAQKGAAE